MQQDSLFSTFGDPRLPARFWAKVKPNPASGCWIWRGASNSRGYPCFAINRRSHLAHRVAYAALVEALDATLTLDHVTARGCTTKMCVNPDHLEPVSNAENIRRAWDDRGRATQDPKKSFEATFVVDGEPLTRRPFRTHCPRGHEYTEANTYVSRTKTGAVSRQCKTCAKHRAKYGVYPDAA